MLKSPLFPLSLIMLSLAGCGGDGGVGYAPPPNTGTLTGLVADGYLQGATVFADINENGVLDEGEPTAQTGEKGAYSLQIPSSVISPSILVDVPASAIDEDNGQPVGRPYRLSTVIGLYGAINPVTTLMRAVMQTRPGMSGDEAETYIRSAFDLNAKFKVQADYLDPQSESGLTPTQNAQNKKDAAKMHKAARVVAYYLGVRQEEAVRAFGGQIPPGSFKLVHAILTAEILAHGGEIARQLPDGDPTAFDPATITLNLPALTMQRLQADAATIAASSNIALGDALGESDIYFYPFRTEAGEFARFKLSVQPGLGTSLTQKSIKSDNALLSAAGARESDIYGLVGGGTLPSLFKGSYLFNTNKGFSELTVGSNNVLKLRISQSDVSGDRIARWMTTLPLANDNAVWPAGAKAYRVLLNNTSAIYAGLDTTPSVTMKLPDDLLANYGETGQDYKLGKLGLHFLPAENSQVSPQVGALKFNSFETGVVQPLPNQGEWQYSRDDGVNAMSLKIPAEYRPLLGAAAVDPLFAGNYHPTDIVLINSFLDGKTSRAWRTPAGRVTEFVFFNKVAADALEQVLRY